MGDDDKARWKRLGELLTARRVALGGSNRSRFLQENDVVQQARIISDIELGKRANYERGTLSLIEHVYRWEPGSIADVLAGGEPRILLAPHHGSLAKGTPIRPTKGVDIEIELPGHGGPVGGDLQDDEPVLFLLTAEERQRLGRLPADERQRVLDAARAAARATADALLGMGDEE